ncbi:MAG: hypothetical protein IT581_06620 [Verrucomicrobiales bacterium]|nr:hypothetical protein [Verrucomicrobiales bacterium]
MNSWKPLETTLRGLRPRRPSRDIRSLLFEAAPGSAMSSPTPASALALPPVQLWLAPFAAAAMLVLTLATAWTPLDSGSGPSLSLAGLSAAAAPGFMAAEQNAPPEPRIRSTNAGTIASSFGSLLLRQTNVFTR